MSYRSPGSDSDRLRAKFVFSLSLRSEQIAFRASSSLSSLDIIKLAHLYDANPVCKKIVEELNEKVLKSYYCRNNSDLPVLESKICDNKLDCPDGQDEDRDPRTKTDPSRDGKIEI